MFYVHAKKILKESPSYNWRDIIGEGGELTLWFVLNLIASIIALVGLLFFIYHFIDFLL